MTETVKKVLEEQMQLDEETTAMPSCRANIVVKKQMLALHTSTFSKELLQLGQLQDILASHQASNMCQTRFASSLIELNQQTWDCNTYLSEPGIHLESFLKARKLHVGDMQKQRQGS